MNDTLIDIIVSGDEGVRNRALETAVGGMTAAQLLKECESLDGFRRSSRNLYDRVRALFFLYAIHRFHLPLKAGLNPRGFVPFDGYEQLLKRRFEEAIAIFVQAQQMHGPNDAISSALAAAYHGLAF